MRSNRVFLKCAKKVGALHSFPSQILIQNERWPELMWSPLRAKLGRLTNTFSHS